MQICFLIGLNFITMVHGFASRPLPQSTCQSMSVTHERRGVTFPPQTTESPFEVSYKHGPPGEPITVFLRSKGATPFVGFMLEARERDKVDEGHPIGRFIILESGNSVLMTCNGLPGSAVCQPTNLDKTLVKVNWTQEEELNITFRATFLESFSKFWEKVDVNVTPPTTPPTTPSTEPTTTASPTSTPKPSSTTSMPKPSTTTSTPKPSTTTSTPKPSTTISIPKPNTTLGNTNGISPEDIGAILVIIHSSIKPIKTELLNIDTILNRYFSQSLNKRLTISCCVLCAAVEIIALVLFYVGHYSEATLAALMCVVIVINFTELVITCLPLGPSHELKDICDITGKLCIVIHEVFTNAVIFIAALEFDCRRNRKESRLLIVTIAYTVWIFLYVIWFFGFGIHKKTLLRWHKTGSSRSTEEGRQQRQKRKISAAEATVVAVSGIIVIGTISFIIAFIFGILGCQTK